jgi:hypothetical protein
VTTWFFGTEIHTRSFTQVLGIVLVTHGQHGSDDEGNDESDAGARQGKIEAGRA